MTEKLSDAEFLKKYAADVAAFREFCLRYGGDSAFEETDFTDLSVGFFVARGVTEDLINPEVDGPAWRLARICRYNLQYWEGETL